MSDMTSAEILTALGAHTGYRIAVSNGNVSRYETIISVDAVAAVVRRRRDGETRTDVVSGPEALIRAYGAFLITRKNGSGLRTVSHAYSHMIGRTVGIGIDGIGVVAATVMTPDLGQDDNVLSVQTEDNTWHMVRWDDIYRADFINASLSEHVWNCPTVRPAPGLEGVRCNCERTF